MIWHFLWMDSGIRNSITAAADAIDRMLAVNPNAKGMEVHEGLRRLTVKPLVVQFSSDEQTEVVTVYSVRLTIK